MFRFENRAHAGRANFHRVIMVNMAMIRIGAHFIVVVFHGNIIINVAGVFLM